MRANSNSRWLQQPSTLRCHLIQLIHLRSFQHVSTAGPPSGDALGLARPRIAAIATCRGDVATRSCRCLQNTVVLHLCAGAGPLWHRQRPAAVLPWPYLGPKDKPRLAAVLNPPVGIVQQQQQPPLGGGGVNTPRRPQAGGPLAAVATNSHLTTTRTRQLAAQVGRSSIGSGLDCAAVWFCHWPIAGFIMILMASMQCVGSPAPNAMHCCSCSMLLTQAQVFLGWPTSEG